MADKLTEKEIIDYVAKLIKKKLPDKKRITGDWELISCNEVLAVFWGELTEDEATLVAEKYNEIIQQIREAEKEANAFVKQNLGTLIGLAPFNLAELEPLVKVDNEER